MASITGPSDTANDGEDDDVVRNRPAASRTLDCSFGVRSGDRTSANPLLRSAETSDRDLSRGGKARFSSRLLLVLVPMSMRGTVSDDDLRWDLVAFSFVVDCRWCVIGIVNG